MRPGSVRTVASARRGSVTIPGRGARPVEASPRKGSIIEALNEFIQSNATAFWVLPAVFALCVVDGIFPVVPSESVLVALAAVGASLGEDDLVRLAAVGAAGAFVGDQIAYAVGRHSGLSKLRHRQDKPRVRRMLRWAESELGRRGAMIVFAARYVPGGRVAVNVTAGMTHFSRWRFTIFDFFAALSWAAYSVGLGHLAGRWLKDNPLLGAAVAVVLAIVVGYLIDLLLQRFGGAPPMHEDVSAEEAAGHGAEVLGQPGPDHPGHGSLEPERGPAEPGTSAADDRRPRPGVNGHEQGQHRA